jgi:hypothetical protein
MLNPAQELQLSNNKFSEEASAAKSLTWKSAANFFSM